MPDKMEKYFNVNTVYLAVAVIMLAIIIQKKNPIDILYFTFITVYYLRIKIYRWRKI